MDSFIKPIFFTFFLILVSCKTNIASADTIPASLKRFANVHPRLYMTAQSQKVLKAKMNTQPYASMLEKLKAIADKAVSRGPTAYYPAFSAGGGSGADLEQLWQREVGNAIPELAMAYCMTGTKKYLDAARYYMLASASYPTWGMGRLDNYDLATAHQLYGIALGYDWLYDDLDGGSRDYIRNCLIRRGGRLYDLISEGKWGYANNYLHNHQHVDLTGLITAGLALYGENKDIDKWILLARQKLKRAISSMPPDGGFIEGISYSEYSIEYLMKFMALDDELLGEDLFKSSSFFRNLASFRLYAMISKCYWKLSKFTVMTLADNPRRDGHGPLCLLRKLASEYNDGYAQWLANEIDSAGINAPQAFFLNLLWINPKIKPEPPDELPLFKHFNDLDIVYMRSGWSGKESLSMFKCGPWIGHRAASEYTYDPYGGHTHPDVGTFQIFSHGDWLITYPGYSWKRTIYQNTLIVNGKGQIGEGRWFQGKLYVQAPEQPGIVNASSNNDYDYIIGNAKPAYPSATHLTSYYRHILYLKPDCWVVADEVKADSLSKFEFYYHSDFPFSPDGANRFTVEGRRGSTGVTLLKPGDATPQTFLQDIEGTGGGLAKRMNALKVATKDKTNDLFITVFDAYATGQTPAIQPSIISSKGSDFLVLKSKNKTWHFKIASNRKDKSTPLFIEMK
jgi:hypothetical protein